MSTTVYGDFDLLCSQEMFAQVKEIRVNSLTCWNIATSLMEYWKARGKKGKQKYYTNIVRQSLTQYHLTEYFFKSKDAHDLQSAILELEQLDVQRLSMEGKSEFEAAAKLRDAQEKIRNYLNSNKQYESGTTVG